MFYLFEKIGRFILKLAVLGLILVISVQFLMNNEESYNRVKEVETVVKNIFTTNSSNEVMEVTQDEIQEEHGVITFKLLQNLSLPQVWVRCNGEKIENFSEGKATIKVKKGDFLTIDSTNYNDELWFEINDRSSNIQNFKNGQQYRTRGEMLNIGVVNVETTGSDTRL
ncbi:MAG: hypothetical protein ACOCP5_01145 [Halanaerobiaceae bacterium]